MDNNGDEILDNIINNLYSPMINCSDLNELFRRDNNLYGVDLSNLFRSGGYK